MKTKIFTLLVLGMMFLSGSPCQAKNIIHNDNLTLNPSIGILGTALNGWNVDVDMQTTDGINYTLSNYPLTAGSAKFRQDDSWSINWGNSAFPVGIGIQNGPNIPIPSPGNYDISFNRLTGNYSFVCVSNCSTTNGIIGIIGDALNGWVDDVDMLSADGITFILKNYTFKNGEAKFRQDNSWNINWGNNTFPTGTAFLDGPNIPVTAGTYDVTFNIVTGDYSFTFLSIGVLGSALIGWDDDIDLQSTDGIIYTLKNYPFNEGEVKFRQDNNWDVNWGFWSFPNGFGEQNGANILVMAGSYDVTFNRITGEYNFVATSCEVPAINCPSNIYVNSEPDLCGAVVNYQEVTAAANCGGEGITITQIEGLPSGSLFPVGYTLNTFEISNIDEKKATCSFFVAVQDIEPPKITGIPDQLPSLWPPNHKMIPIHLDYTVTDNCGKNSTSSLYVYSNEPDNGLGDGDLANDWKIVDNHNILLRAERSGTGEGRTYYIYINSFDESGNWSNKLVTVSVPHDQDGKVNTTRAIKKETISGNSLDNLPFTTTVWPNPSTNSFNIEVQSTTNENVVLSVFDINGRHILNLNARSNQTTSFGEDLKAGNYLVLVRQGNNYNTIKVVKQ